MTYWIVYQNVHWTALTYGFVEPWGRYRDPNYELAGIAYPNEGWLMIPPSTWECE